MQQEQQLPPGWQAALHPTYQRYYYVHLASGTSQWEPPTAAAAAAAAAPAAAPDPSTPAAAAPAAAAASARTASHYRYYDPHGKLLGPFSLQQLTAWRAFLPMDLILVPLSDKPSSNSSSPAGAAAAAGDNQQQQQQQQGAGDAGDKPQHWLHLAELLGDGHLLAAWQQSAEQQQLLQAQQQQQQQPWPPRARAPPAPVYESWCHSHYAASSAYPAAAAAAPAASPVAPAPVQAASSQQQEQQQPEPEWHQHPWHHQPATAAGISSSGGMARASSGFDKYAAAVLQGLPPDDEAVRLAGIAAAYGCTLQELLQAKAEADAAKAAAAAAAADAAAAGTAAAVPANPEDRICYEQKPGFGGVLLTKDPRSGRLTAVGGGGGGGGGPSAIGCSRAMAVELYGDLARWVDPASLEQSLQKASKAKRLAAAQGPLPPPTVPPPVAASAAGGGAASKKMRLRL